ncbi:MAG TPA: metalloregulator ArsR/SmtB family transcription factor [Geobacteraceae bacterium]|nr:metalloregulator ArsR/SmtB family transcription factor [Geobacteraceae bacterium]
MLISATQDSFVGLSCISVPYMDSSSGFFRSRSKRLPCCWFFSGYSLKISETKDCWVGKYYVSEPKFVFAAFPDRTPHGQTILDYNRINGYIGLMKTTARMFKALSDETRLRILCLLLDGELCVCDIMAVLQLPQSTVSRHLAYLKNTGWVNDRRCGVWMYYSIMDNGNSLQKRLLESLRENLSDIETAAADRERLNRFSQHNSCA